MSHVLQELTWHDGIEETVVYKVKNVFTKTGAHIFRGKRICELINEAEKRTVSVKARFGGVVSKLLIKAGDEIVLGNPLVEIDACTHPTLLGNICCDCGIVLEPNANQSEENKSHGLVSMLHSVPDLKVSKEEATRLGKEDIKHLLEKQKLVLLVDLDQTLIHTTNDNIPPKLKDVFHFQLIQNGPWYHTRLRPYTSTFLHNISQLYELHICTFGVREYAHCIAHFLDPDRKLFGDRILSRNECLDPMFKKANLSSLFPCGDNLVCIIDDRSDVWNFAPNVVQVMPYHFFQHTGDINAPPGLQKKENDNTRTGFDFSNLEELSSTNKGKRKRNQDEKKEDKNEVSFEEKQRDLEKSEEYSLADEDEKESKDEETNSISLDISPPPSPGKPEMTEPPALNEKEDTKPSLNEKEDTKPSLNEKEDTKTSLNEKEDTKTSLNEKEDTKTSLNEKEDTKTSLNEKEDTKTSLNGKEDTKTSLNEKEDTKLSLNEKEDTKPALDAKALNEKTADESRTNDSEDNLQSNKGLDTQNDSDTVDVEDSDDYLLYLEDILKKLHTHFYGMYDPDAFKGKNTLPDLKEIVPQIRKIVLSDIHLVFSGIVPQNTDLKESKAYHIATSLGATVSEKLITKSKKEPSAMQNLNYTTHVVAANLHTEKVHQAKRLKTVKIVTPNWLWCCAERWEHVDERLFKLTDESERSIVRNPPLHCFVNLNETPSQDSDMADPTPAKEEHPIFDSLNPFAFFSNDETKSMEEEVDHLLSSEEDCQPKTQNKESENSDSTEDSALESSPKASSDEDDDEDNDKKRKRRRTLEDDDEEEEEEEEEELPSIRFRQGGSLPSDESEADSADEDMNAYGDILARELMRE